MQHRCSCHTVSAGSAKLQPVGLQRTAPFASRSHLRLGSCQARRGVAINTGHVAVRQPLQIAQLTTCRAADKSADKPAAKTAAKPAPKQIQQPTSAVAHLRFSRGSPSKVRRVLDNIRGRPYEDALGILEYAPYRACEPLLKLLISAGANAKNLGLKKVKLYISECYCDEGPILKRIKTRAKGRANRIAKLTNHISIRVAERAS